MWSQREAAAMFQVTKLHDHSTTANQETEHSPFQPLGLHDSRRDCGADG